MRETLGTALDRLVAVGRRVGHLTVVATSPLDNNLSARRAAALGDTTGVDLRELCEMAGGREDGRGDGRGDGQGDGQAVTVLTTRLTDNGRHVAARRLVRLHVYPCMNYGVMITLF